MHQSNTSETETKGEREIEIAGKEREFAPIKHIQAPLKQSL